MVKIGCIKAISLDCFNSLPIIPVVMSFRHQVLQPAYRGGIYLSRLGIIPVSHYTTSCRCYGLQPTSIQSKPALGRQVISWPLSRKAGYKVKKMTKRNPAKLETLAERLKK
jgi:hypothetical protein